MLRIKLKELLAKKKITFKLLSEVTGINHRWLSEFANGHISLFQDEKIVKMCIALDCTPNDLFEVEEENIQKKSNLKIA